MQSDYLKSMRIEEATSESYMEHKYYKEYSEFVGEYLENREQFRDTLVLLDNTDLKRVISDVMIEEKEFCTNVRYNNKDEIVSFISPQRTYIETCRNYELRKCIVEDLKIN